jgi:hypothetical protein
MHIMGVLRGDTEHHPLVEHIRQLVRSMFIYYRYKSHIESRFVGWWHFNL